MMKTVEQLLFFKSLEVDQMIELRLQMDVHMHEDILPAFAAGCSEVLFNHFLPLAKGASPVFASINATYTHGGNMRVINEVRVYETEIEMDFYMSLLEYENGFANKALFN